MSANEQFRNRHPGLAWSNPDADDSVRIRVALLRPRFRRQLEIACEFGLSRLRREWDALTCEADASVERARCPVNRILHNIEQGFARADAARKPRAT